MLIHGGATLNGTVEVQGAKNAALPVIAASLLLKDKSLKIRRVPKLQDVFTMAELLRHLGAKVDFRGNDMNISVPDELAWETPKTLVRKMRASSLVLGPLLARTGRAILPLPGGCAIGSRPIDLHLKGLVKLGASIDLVHGAVHATANGLKGAKIYLDFPSVGATENLLMAAVFADGETVIENAAREPEIANLIETLRLMGCAIEGAGTGTLRITGTGDLGPAEVEVIPDRIEASTYLIAGAATRGDVTVSNVITEHLDAIIAKLEETGVGVEIGENTVRVFPRSPLKSVSLKTLPYPGFPTDVQPQFSALMSTTDGTSIIQESVFESRFLHVSELKRMGANIEVQGNTAVVTGVPRLNGADVRATDLRAGAALVIAGLSSTEDTSVFGLGHIWRGYEGMDEKIRSLGGDVHIVISEENGDNKW
ncbi:MAG TPA: UDP-N-acetylglucosamine 1-carboxyvinyltransferase [Synergistetes bacterium]|nr:UDP-N-acetylglucosamine 1-carboxyvinyltransferase [Synergistota bacterium]